MKITYVEIITVSFTLWAFVVTIIHAAADYCNQQCPSRTRHTMCLFPEAAPSAKCTHHASYPQGLTANEKHKILDKHNLLRRAVAAGKEKRGNPGPQPAAKFMNKLEWDFELETIAQRWANQCKGMHHDTCRDVDRFSVGQNLASSMTTGDISSIRVEQMVQAWYDEVKDLNKKDVSYFRDVGKKAAVVGHYTQLVWGDTKKIGCGAVKYGEHAMKKLYLVCNYGPAGNIISQPIYHPTFRFNDTAVEECLN